MAFGWFEGRAVVPWQVSVCAGDWSYPCALIPLCKTVCSFTPPRSLVNLTRERCQLYWLGLGFKAHICLDTGTHCLQAWLLYPCFYNNVCWICSTSFLLLQSFFCVGKRRGEVIYEMLNERISSMLFPRKQGPQRAIDTTATVENLFQFGSHATEDTVNAAMDMHLDLLNATSFKRKCDFWYIYIHVSLLQIMFKSRLEIILDARNPVKEPCSITP